ncbi:amino acid synthesis family protein [Bradyrhizobium sp. 1]|uniref:amino acid synthesis family protein n=1 Tax=Bradyrhizobium sp. 1 TaxID=241591 RepID=UPI001FF7CC12|nr:amino acid synthesis family protein [Bradyrhizobium sp. 1]
MASITPTTPASRRAGPAHSASSRLTRALQHDRQQAHRPLQRPPFRRELATRLIAQLGGAALVEAYGKGIIVGEDGELEHGAVWHEAGGHGMPVRCLRR